MVNVEKIKKAIHEANFGFIQGLKPLKSVEVIQILDELLQSDAKHNDVAFFLSHCPMINKDVLFDPDEISDTKNEAIRELLKSLAFKQDEPTALLLARWGLHHPGAYGDASMEVEQWFDELTESFNYSRLVESALHGDFKTFTEIVNRGDVNPTLNDNMLMMIVLDKALNDEPGAKSMYQALKKRASLPEYVDVLSGFVAEAVRLPPRETEEKMEWIDSILEDFPQMQAEHLNRAMCELFPVTNEERREYTEQLALTLMQRGAAWSPVYDPLATCIRAGDWSSVQFLIEKGYHGNGLSHALEVAKECGDGYVIMLEQMQKTQEPQAGGPSF